MFEAARLENFLYHCLSIYYQNILLAWCYWCSTVHCAQKLFTVTSPLVSLAFFFFAKQDEIINNFYNNIAIKVIKILHCCRQICFIFDILLTVLHTTRIRWVWSLMNKICLYSMSDRSQSRHYRTPYVSVKRKLGKAWNCENSRNNKNTDIVCGLVSLSKNTRQCYSKRNWLLVLRHGFYKSPSKEMAKRKRLVDISS